MKEKDFHNGFQKDPNSLLYIRDKSEAKWFIKFLKMYRDIGNANKQTKIEFIINNKWGWIQAKSIHSDKSGLSTILNDTNNTADKIVMNINISNKSFNMH